MKVSLEKSPWVVSDDMPRTTLNIDAVVLAELRRRSKLEGRSTGVLASELLADALGTVQSRKAPALLWHSRDLGYPRVELEDKESVYLALDRGGGPRTHRKPFSD